MPAKTTIDDLRDILNENDYPEVKFVLHAVKDNEEVIFERELNQPDMWFYIYPALIKAKLNDWSKDLSFMDSGDIRKMVRHE